MEGNIGKGKREREGEGAWLRRTSETRRTSLLPHILNLIDRAYIQLLYDCKHQHSPSRAHTSHAIPLTYTRHVTQRPLPPVMVRLVEALARGHTSFEQRFPGKERRLDAGLPPLAPWRSNLVRASLQSPLLIANTR
jgi:hypothetical protein